MWVDDRAGGEILTKNKDVQLSTENSMNRTHDKQGSFNEKNP